MRDLVVPSVHVSTKPGQLQTAEQPGGSALSGQAALNAGYDTREQVCFAGPNSGGSCAAPPTGATAYTYDAANEITGMGSSTLSYNSANELCWTLSSGSSNGCATPPTGATTYGYDTRGNRVSVVPSSGAATCDAYDQADRLITVTSGTGASCTGPTTVGNYTYNSDGLRMSKTVGSTTTKFAWNLTGSLPALLQERVSGGSVTDYVYGPEGTPLEQISGSTVLLYHADQLGSTRVLTDTSGTIQATYGYDAYGNVTSSTGSVVNPFLFAGQYLDAESGLYYLQARYYDPATAQFLTRDPFDATTREAYEYGLDNPLTFTDPTGQVFTTDGGGDYSLGATQLLLDPCAGKPAGTPGCTSPVNALLNRLDAGVNNAGQGFSAGVAVFGTGGCLAASLVGCTAGSAFGGWGGLIGGFIDGFCTDTKRQLPSPWDAWSDVPGNVHESQ